MTTYPLGGLRDLDKRRAELDELGDFALLAGLVMTTKSIHEAVQKAEARGAPPRVVDVLTKATQAAGTTSGSGISNFGNLLGTFMSAVRNVGAFDQVAQSALRVPLESRVNIYTAISGGTTSEGAGKAIRRVRISASDLTMSKANVTIVLTRELIDGLGEVGLRSLATELKTAVATASDAAFLAALAGESGEASGTPTWSGFVDDLTELMRLVSAGSNSQLFLIAPPRVAKAIATYALTAGLNIDWRNGELAGVRLIASDAQSPGRLTLVDSSGLAIGLGEIELRSSENATIEMSDTPTQDSSTSTGSNVVSMFQTNSRALICERRFTVKPIRPGSHAHLVNVAIAEPSDSPSGV